MAIPTERQIINGRTFASQYNPGTFDPIERVHASRWVRFIEGLKDLLLFYGVKT